MCVCLCCLLFAVHCLYVCLFVVCRVMFVCSWLLVGGVLLFAGSCSMFAAKVFVLIVYCCVCSCLLLFV